MTQEMKAVCDQLIERLNRIERNSDNQKFFKNGYFTGDCDEIRELELDLNELISEDGSRVDLDVRDYMQAHGYPIKKGESDSFGWLSAICFCEFGKLVFG